ncbi:MAG: NAD(P)-dependent alcohol dehydrogenase [Candidatus Promineifilaceae bacterium]
MMKAMVCTKYGSPDVLQLQEVEKPVPLSDEVLIKIHATTATTASVIGRTGKPHFVRLFFGLTKPRKAILGQELAGEIETIGCDVTSFQVGDKVFGMTGTELGTHAQYKRMNENSVLTRMPQNASFDDAAAIVEGGLTALNFLKHKAGIQAGQHIAIYGASGSVGTASIQVAKAFGTTVTAICSSTNFDLVRSLGADFVIDYRQEDFTENGIAYDIIFDTVGKLSFSRCKTSLTSAGIYLDAGGIGTIFPMMWTSLFGGRRAMLATTYTRSAEANLADLETLKTLFEHGKFRAVIDKWYPLDDLASAYKYIDTGRKKGNLVVKISHSI